MRAEDYQPNETRAIPKGGSIPTVRSTVVPRYSRPNSQGTKSRQWRPVHRKSWHHPYRATDQAYLGGDHRVFQSSSAGRNTERAKTISRPTFNTPTRPQDRSFPPDVHDLNRPQSVDQRNEYLTSLYGDSRRIRRRQSSSTEQIVQRTRPLLSEISNPGISAAPVRETHVVVYDVPGAFNGDAKASRNSRRGFIKQSIKEIQERFDATIHSHEVDHGKLTINYSYDGFPACPGKINNSSMDHSGHENLGKRDIEIGVETSNTPSGSNIKLEDMQVLIDTLDTARPSKTTRVSVMDDLDRRVSKQETRKRTVDSQYLPKSFLIDVGSIPYRPYRSGTLVLSSTSDRQVSSITPVSEATNISAQSVNSGRQLLSGVQSTAQEPVGIDIPAQPGSGPSQEFTQELIASEPVTIEILDTPCPSPSSNTDHYRGHAGYSPDDFIPCLHFDEVGEEFLLRKRKEERDKPRRLLSAGGQNMSYLISTHATVHELTSSSPRRQGEVYRHENASSDVVEDVCLLPAPYNNIMVLAQSTEGRALSLLYVSGERGKKGRLVNIARPSQNPDRRLRGASAVAPLLNNPLAFVSGGYDHIIHLWTLDATANSKISDPIPIDIKHNSTVQSLLSVDDMSPKLLSAGADCCVNIWDIPSERPLMSIKTSNSVYHLHRTERPENILLEVAHRDSQFELHDYRTESTRPVARFGFQTTQLQGRYAKGDVRLQNGSCAIISGSRDGSLRLWDLRNTYSCCQEILCFPQQRIVHAVFEANHAVAICEDNRMLSFEIDGV